MKKHIKKIPLPATGVMLGCAGLGNLLQSYGEAFHIVFGCISALIGILFIIKVLTDFEGFKNDMKNPVFASISGTFSMALMLLAVYAKPLIGAAAKYIWYLAIGIHIALIVYFTCKFLIHPDIKKVFTSYFIVYVGIVAASMTAPAFQATGVGACCFWFGFVSFILLLVLIAYRYIKYREIAEPLRPLFCIFTAPGSLCVAGYLQSFENKNNALLVAMLTVSVILYIIVLIKIVSFLKLKFYPSYAAFTFPFVISAIALKQSMAYFTQAGKAVAWMSPFVLIETVIATLLVLYALFKYVEYIISVEK